MDYLTVIENIRKTVTRTPNIFSIINNRFYPQRTELQNLQYPCVLTTVSITTPNEDGYPVDDILVDFYYISDSNIDVSHKLCSLVHAILNMKRVTTSDVNFVCKQTTGAIDVTDMYGGKLLYVITNTYRIKAFTV